MFPLALAVCGKLPREEVVAGHAQLISSQGWRLSSPGRLPGACRRLTILQLLSMCYFPPVTEAERHKLFFHLLGGFRATTF